MIFVTIAAVINPEVEDRCRAQNSSGRFFNRMRWNTALRHYRGGNRHETDNSRTMKSVSTVSKRVKWAGIAPSLIMPGEHLP